MVDFYHIISIIGIIVAITIPLSVHFMRERSTKREIKRNRVKYQLNKIYTPLHEIFTNAREMDRGQREHIPSFKFIPNELYEIKKIFHKNGNSNYFDDDISKEIRKRIIYDKNIWVSMNPKLDFMPEELDRIYEYIETKHNNLRKELEELGN